MSFLTHVITWWRGGDSPGLNSAESSLVDLVLQSLPESDQNTLRSQVSGLRLVQRPQPQRIVICFYHEQIHLPLFDSQDEEACLAQITYPGADKKRRKVKLMLYRGSLKTIEGRIPETPVSATDCSVELWPNLRSTIPAALDRLEHGDQQDA